MQLQSKLIRQIREALSAKNSNAPLETFAQEYARLCHEASQRLESCAAMLSKGSDYQALQLAEEEPALLDLIATLSFAEAPEWAAFCATNQLVVAQKFDLKAVQALDGLYSKGISTNHPLYKDYRAAVTSRDDAKALQIIRSIVRLNPDDANAKLELARIENKLFQFKLQELRTVLAQKDEKGTLAELSELERLAPPAKLAELPEFVRAAEVRREAAKQDAIALSARLVESLDEEFKAGAWRMVGDILARLRSLQAEHGFSLESGQSVKVAEMQRYFDVQRAAAEEATAFANSMSTIASLSQGLDARLLTRSTLTFTEAEDLQAKFDLRWKDVEKFKRPVPEELVQRVRTSAAALRAEVDRMQRQRRMKIISASVTAIILAAVAGWFVVAAVRAQEYSTQLARLKSSGQVEAAEKMLAQLRKEDTELAAKPKLRASMDEVDSWTRAERGKVADAEGRLTELEDGLKQGVGDDAIVDLATKLESTSKVVGTIAEGLRPGPEGRLLVVRNQFEARAVTLRDKLTAQADVEISALENAAAEKLGYDQSSEVITTALADIEPKLKALEARAKPQLAVLEFPASQQARLSALRKRFDLFQEETGTLTKVREGLVQASTLDAYTQALGAYKESRLTQTKEVNDARKLIATFPKPDDLLASILMPNDPIGWAAAKKDAGGGTFAPDTVLQPEINKILALRDDQYINDIWEVSFTDFEHKNIRRHFYSRGAFYSRPGGSINGMQTFAYEGKIYEPAAKNETPVFSPVTSSTVTPQDKAKGKNPFSSELSSFSKCVNQLELQRMTNGEGSKFERSLLHVFTELVRDKTANPVGKAFLMQELASVLKIRPLEWGSQYCGSLRSDLAELDRLLEGTRLSSQDWLIDRKNTQLGSKLGTYFKDLENRDYLAEARAHREVISKVIKAGLQFGGFIESTGGEHILGEARNWKTLWTLSADGQALEPYLSGKAKQGAANFRSLAPIFFVPLDRATLLHEVTSKPPKQPASRSQPPTIPWLQNP